MPPEISSPDPHGSHQEVQERVEHAAAAAEHSAAFPAGYIDKVRATAAALAAPEARADDIRAAVAMLEQHAMVSGVAPIDATNAGSRAAKRVVRKAVFFTTNHVASQVSSLGWASVWLGTAAADRIEALEREVADLRARVERLEPPPAR